MYDLDETALQRVQQLMVCTSSCRVHMDTTVHWSQTSMLQDSGDAAKLLLAERLWLALPFTHSEKLQDQQVHMHTISARAQGLHCC